MKLATFRYSDDRDRLGIVLSNDRKLLDIQAAHELETGAPNPALFSLQAFIEGGERALELGREMAAEAPDTCITPIADVTLRTPLPKPPQIRDCLCFEEHLINAYNVLRKVKADAEPDPALALREFEAKGLFRIPEVWYQQPIYYKANRFSVIGSGQDIEWPPYAEMMDYEMEFGIFIGKGGKDIPKDRAREHIFGYSIFNDVSARDTQTIEMPGGLGPSKSKDFDTGNIIGPWVVTADELDPYDLDMIVRVNGEERSRGNSSSIHWTFEDLIAHITKSETIHPGEFIASGTVGGGSGLEWQRYLAPGDTIELEVDGIGILKNKIIRT